MVHLSWVWEIPLGKNGQGWEGEGSRCTHSDIGKLKLHVGYENCRSLKESVQASKQSLDNYIMEAVETAHAAFAYHTPTLIF